jgi:hypothetical protein
LSAIVSITAASDCATARQADAFLERTIETWTIIAHLQTQHRTIGRSAEIDRSISRPRGDAVANRILDQWLQDQVRHARVERRWLHVDVYGAIRKPNAISASKFLVQLRWLSKRRANQITTGVNAAQTYQ